MSEDVTANGSDDADNMSEEEIQAAFAAELEKKEGTKKDGEDKDEASEEEMSEEEIQAAFEAELKKAESEKDAAGTSGDNAQKAEGEAKAPKQELSLEEMARGMAPPPITQPVKVRPVELPSAEETLEELSHDPAARDINLKMILDIPVDVHVEVGSTMVTVQDILRLGSGSIIELDRVAGQPADIIVNGKLIGQGDIVVVNENFGIRITKLVGLEQRLDSI